MNALGKHNRSQSGTPESDSLERDLLVTVVVAALLSLAVAAYVRFVDATVAAYPMEVHVWARPDAKLNASSEVRNADARSDRLTHSR